MSKEEEILNSDIFKEMKEINKKLKDCMSPNYDGEDDDFEALLILLDIDMQKLGLDKIKDEKERLSMTAKVLKKLSEN